MISADRTLLQALRVGEQHILIELLDKVARARDKPTPSSQGLSRPHTNESFRPFALREEAACRR